jgi:transcriptional regulator with XRE-family HTH domain
MVTKIRSARPVRHFLREWREFRALKQEQLADRLETSKGQVSNWENNKRGLSLDVVGAIADALAIEPADLFRDPHAPSADELLRQATPEKRREVMAVVQTMMRTGTDG